jgi:hypothetical protein
MFSNVFNRWWQLNNESMREIKEKQFEKLCKKPVFKVNNDESAGK